MSEEPQAPCPECDGYGTHVEDMRRHCFACNGTGHAPPAAVPAPPRAHVFVPTGRFTPAENRVDLRYCNICGLIERADGTNKPCSGQIPSLSLRGTDEVPAPDAAEMSYNAVADAFERWKEERGVYFLNCSFVQDQRAPAFRAGAEWQAQRQSAQRDALAGLVKRWTMLGGGPVGQDEAELAYDRCADELAAILEGKP